MSIILNMFFNAILKFVEIWGYYKCSQHVILKFVKKHVNIALTKTFCHFQFEFVNNWKYYIALTKFSIAIANNLGITLTFVILPFEIIVYKNNVSITFHKLPSV
jgi:hypothetical protein